MAYTNTPSPVLYLKSFNPVSLTPDQVLVKVNFHTSFSWLPSSLLYLPACAVHYSFPFANFFLRFQGHRVVFPIDFWVVNRGFFLFFFFVLRTELTKTKDLVPCFLSSFLVEGKSYVHVCTCMCACVTATLPRWHAESPHASIFSQVDAHAEGTDLAMGKWLFLWGELWGHMTA